MHFCLFSAVLLVLLSGHGYASPTAVAQFQPQASPYGQAQPPNRPPGSPYNQGQPQPRPYNPGQPQAGPYPQQPGTPYGQPSPNYPPPQANPNTPPSQANPYNPRPPQAMPYSPPAPQASPPPQDTRPGRPSDRGQGPRPGRPTNQAPPPPPPPPPSSRTPRGGRPTNQAPLPSNAPPAASYSRGGQGPPGGRPTSSQTQRPGAPPTPPASPPPNAPPPAAGGGCPAAWTQISQDLTKLFVGADGQCTDSARQAIRATFHDCGTWNTAQGNTGGCDGSLVLSPEENAKPENRGLQDISNKLQAMATKYKVGVADMVAYAGSHATVSCPLGPTVPIKIGRTDSNKAANEALLPGNATMSADTILSLFSDKGFSPPEVSALVGAHSTSRQFFANPAKAGQPQDSTPGVWDVKFYSETTAQPPPANVAIFPSDMNLAADPRSGPAFKSFVNAQVRWNRAFADTFSKLSMLGNDQSKMVDCTATLPKPRTSFP